MLSLCSSCQRHVKSVPCPFCGGAAILATAQRAGSSSGGSRASLLIGAALVSATVGCNDRSTNAAAPVSASDANAQAGVEPHPSADVYGAPPAIDDARSDAGGPVLDERLPAPVYGAPPVEPMLKPPMPKPPH